MRIFIFAGGGWLNCVWRGSSCFLYPKNMFCNALWKSTVDVSLHWNTSIFLIFFSLFLGTVPGISATICVEIQWPLWDDAERRQVVRTCLSYQKLRQPCLFQDRRFLNSPSTCSVISTKTQLTGDPRGGKDGWWSSRSSCRGELFSDNLRKTATSKLTASSFECCRLNQGPKKKRRKTKRPIVSGVVAQCSCCSWVGVGIPGSQEKKDKKEKTNRKAGIHELGEDVPITFHVLMICEFQWYCCNATQDESKNMLCHLIAGTGVWSGVLGGSFQLIVDISLLDRWKEASMSG